MKYFEPEYYSITAMIEDHLSSIETEVEKEAQVAEKSETDNTNFYSKN